MDRPSAAGEDANMAEEGRGDLRADVLIVTAIQLEYDGVLAVETGAVRGSSWQVHKDRNGLPFAVRHFTLAEGAGGRPLSIAVTCAPDMGDVAATNVMLPLLEALRPKVVAMCGVCAGRPGKTALGDVVAADKLFFHDSGKRIGTKGADGEQVTRIQQDIATYLLRPDWKRALEGIKPERDYASAEWLWERPVPIEWQERRVLAWAKANAGATPDAEWIAKNCPQWEQVIEGLWKERKLADGSPGRLCEDGSLTLTEAGRKHIDRELLRHRGGLPDLSPLGETLPFKVHVASFASGDQVVEDEAVWTFIAASMRKTLGLDMEAAALGALAHYQRAAKVDAIVMKAVMDFANHGRDDHYKDFAARASAECLIDFLRKNVRPEVRAGYDDLLVDGTDPPPANPAPSQLLNARNVVVPWHEQGRAEVLADLDRWVDEDTSAVSVRLIHAEGGVGKTRLGIEWVRRRRGRHEVAGFLVQRPGERWLERLCGLGEVAIVVIDYAESRTDLGALLERVSAYERQEGPRTRLRVLLLARNAGDWWSTLGRGNSAVGALLGQQEAKELGPVAVREAEREAVFREALEVFAAVRRKSVVGRAPIRFDDERFERVLYLHMAALAAVEGTEFRAGTLMEVTLDHEERFWMERGRVSGNVRTGAIDVEAARRIVAAATLRGGLSGEEIAGEVAGRVSKGGVADVDLLELLHRIYGRSGEGVWVSGLEPDLLGEQMVRRVAVGRDGKQPIRAEWIERVFVDGDEAAALRIGFTVLGRTSTMEDAPLRPWIERLLSEGLGARAVLALDAAKAVGRQTAFSMLGEVLAEQLVARGSSDIAQSLERAGLPHLSVSLAQVTEWVARALHATASMSDEAAMLFERARNANNLGARLRALGRPEEALAASQEAVGTYRTLSKRNPDAFLPDLANSLNNLGAALSALGRREEALVASQEAVDLRRTLAKRNPDAFLPDLANSFNNLGAMFSALGRREEALLASQEAVDLRHTLSKRNPDAFLPTLANSLNNLGVMLSDLGRREEALVASQEAVDLRRTLTKRNPDAFLPDLAMSLNNLGNRFSALGRQEEALMAAQEAVDTHRTLAKRNPDAFVHNLANSLSNFGATLSALGRREEALVASQEAVDLRRTLAKRNPDAFLSALAVSLYNLGYMLGDLSRREEALVAVTEAIDTIWPSYLHLPRAYAQHTGIMLGHALKLYEALQREPPSEFMERLAAFRP